MEMVIVYQSINNVHQA